MWKLKCCVNKTKEFYRDKKNETLLRGSGGALIVKLAGIPATFALHMVLTRSLGVESYGVLVYALVWLNACSMVSAFGSEFTLSRFVAAYRAQDLVGKLHGLIIGGAGFVAANSIIIAIIGMSFIAATSLSMTTEQSHTYYIGFVALPFLVLIIYSRGGLKGSKEPSLALLGPLLLQPLLFLFIVIVFYWGVDYPASATFTMVMYLATVATVAVLSLFWLYKRIFPKAAKTPLIYDPREWLGVAVVALVASAMDMLLKQTDIMMLGVLAGTSDAGIYSVASRTSQLAAVGLVAVNAILAPMASELYAIDRIGELERTITSAARVAFLLTMVACLILVGLGEFFLGLFGDEFVAGYLPLSILLLGQIMNAAVGSVNLLLFMTGHQRQAASVLGFAVLLNVGLNYFFISMWGIVGAALATTLTAVIWNLGLYFLVRKLLGIDASILERRRPLR